MRLAFILMVLANLVYFAWHYPRDGNVGTVTMPLPPKTSRSENSIVLLHELDRLRRLDSARPAAPTAAVSSTPLPDERLTEPLPANRCFTVGPFTDREAADRAAARLEAYGAGSRWRSTEKQDRLRYWVSYTAADAAAARQVYNSLQSKGMKDMFLMTDRSDTLSLGLFRGENTARRRVAEVMAMGVEAKIEKKYRTTTEHWLDVSEARDKPLADTAWADVLGSAGAHNQPVDCP